MVLSATPKPGKLGAVSDDYNAAFSCPFSHGLIAGKRDMPQPQSAKSHLLGKHSHTKVRKRPLRAG